MPLESATDRRSAPDRRALDDIHGALQSAPTFAFHESV